MSTRSVLLLSTLAFGLTSGAVGRSQAAPAPPSLGDFFKPGLVLQDRNGDGAVDFVDLRLVLPDRPTEVEVTAAADVAARLGFETEAMNLPLPRGAGGQPAVFVGAGSLASAGTTAQALGATGLGPGDGLVAAFRVDGVPAVAVLGGGDAGTTAAAVMLAGRLPYVWDPKGPTADTVAGDVRDFLKGHNLTATAAGVSAVYVQQDGDAAVRVVVDAQMASGAELVKAQAALNQLRVSRDAKRALSYPGVRALRIRLGAPSSRGAIVDLPRAVAPPAPAEPPARRPGNGAKENLDLSSFYSIEGALADTNNNLIPDRVDVVLSPQGEGSEGVVDLAARLGLESTGVERADREARLGDHGARRRTDSRPRRRVASARRKTDQGRQVDAARARTGRRARSSW